MHFILVQNVRLSAIYLVVRGLGRVDKKENEARPDSVFATNIASLLGKTFIQYEESKVSRGF